MNSTNRYHILKQVTVGRPKMKGSGTPAHKKQFEDVSDMMADMSIREPMKAPRERKEPRERKTTGGSKPLRFRFND